MVAKICILIYTFLQENHFNAKDTAIQILLEIAPLAVIDTNYVSPPGAAVKPDANAFDEISRAAANTQRA